MVQFFQWRNTRQVGFIFYISSTLAELYQRHWQPCCANEFRKLFLQPKLEKKRHILGALGEEDSYKYKGKMQEFLLCCWSVGFGFFLSRTFLILSDMELWVPWAPVPHAHFLSCPVAICNFSKFEFLWGGGMLTQTRIQKSLTGLYPFQNLCIQLFEIRCPTTLLLCGRICICSRSDHWALQGNLHPHYPCFGRFLQAICSMIPALNAYQRLEVISWFYVI